AEFVMLQTALTQVRPVNRLKWGPSMSFVVVLHPSLTPPNAQTWDNLPSVIVLLRFSTTNVGLFAMKTYEPQDHHIFLVVLEQYSKDKLVLIDL
ncbi:hypothetical protein FRC11_003062, partial [Ceratobasidium sp. 423]